MRGRAIAKTVARRSAARIAGCTADSDLVLIFPYRNCASALCRSAAQAAAARAGRASELHRGHLRAKRCNPDHSSAPHAEVLCRIPGKASKHVLPCHSRPLEHLRDTARPARHLKDDALASSLPLLAMMDLDPWRSKSSHNCNEAS
jgi:hypothetical protein